MVLGASAIFHAVAAGPNDDTDASHVVLAATGGRRCADAVRAHARSLSTMGGCTCTFRGSARGSSGLCLVLADARLLC
jgi:hypothetical protein